MVVGITGSTGGLGKRLTEYLLGKQCTIKALVRKTSKIDDDLKGAITYIYGDINDPKTVEEFVKDISVCYHIAAQVAGSTKEILDRVNVEGTRTLCDTILKYNPACHIIYCSSIVVKEVNFYTRHFLSDYTMSKYKAEKVIDQYKNEYGMKITIIYPGYIYGPYDKNFMPAVMQLLKHLPFLIKGGETAAPLIYIDDLCELFYLAGTNPIAIGKKYVSLRKNEIGMHGFLRIIAQKMNYSFPQKTYPKMPMVIAAVTIGLVYKLLRIKSYPPITMRIIGALSKKATYFNDDAVRDLGWDHKVSLQDGAEKAVDWYKNNYNEMRN